HDMFLPIPRAHLAERRRLHPDGRRIGEYVSYYCFAALLEPAMISVVPAQMCGHHMSHGSEVTPPGFIPHNDTQPRHRLVPLPTRAESAQMLFLFVAR